MGDRKKFLVLELDKKDSYRLCMSFHNLEYKNHSLIVRKPRGFFRGLFDPDRDEIEPINNLTEGALSSTNRIYMGNIPTYLKASDVKKICEAYGMLKFFHLATNLVEG